MRVVLTNPIVFEDNYFLSREKDTAIYVYLCRGMNKEKGISFDALFNNASMGILVADDKGCIQSVNPFLLKLFQYKPEELTGARIDKLIPKRFRQKHEKHIDSYYAQPKSRPMGLGMDLYAQRSDGSEFPVEVSLGNYETEEGRFVIAFVSDISPRKEAETALQELNEELEHKVELRTQSLKKAEADLRMALEKERELSELKSRFVSMASHEFRTPLSTILSSAYLISKYTEKEDRMKRDKHVQRIVSSVNMLTDILNDFLSVGRMEEGKIQVRNTTFDLKQLIEQIIGELNGLLNKGQHVHYRHSGATMITSDPSLLRHIVMNLLTNAIKFSPEGSPISIESQRANNTLSLSITDGGIGISEEDQQHLFERFFRGSNAINIQGTGLGLHIVSKYVELLNGSIRCHSKLNNGTTFEMQFNLAHNDRTIA